MKRVIVNGFFPRKNFGDDLFLKAAKFFLDDFKVRNEVKAELSFISWLKELGRVDDYVWLGGTFIDGDSSLKTVFSMLFEFTWVRLRGGRLSFISVGFSKQVPIWKVVAQRYIIRIANSVSVRDNESLLFCNNTSGKISKSLDLVVKYKEELTRTLFKDGVPDETEGRVLISLDKEESLSVISSNVGLFNKEECKYIFSQISSPYVKEKQVRISQKAAAILGLDLVGVSEYIDVNNVTFNIAESALIITDRLHVAICGALIGRKVVVVGVTEKLKSIDLLLSSECMSSVSLIK